MAVIRDFIYLDLPRLQSFASQLLEGLPETETRTSAHEAEFEGEVRAGLPMFLAASANTKAVLSAGSSVTSTVHHRLVALVLEQLEHQGFLWDLEALPRAPDGAFTVLSGEVQVTDPTALRVVFEDWRTLERQIDVLTRGASAEPAKPTRADRRARRVQPTSSISQPYLDAIVGVLRKFGENNVRIRLLNSGDTVAVGVVERDKFVEDLARLMSRHGYVMSGRWEVLAQINVTSDGKSFVPEKEQNLLDIVESSGLEALQSFTDVSGVAGTEDEVKVTPLAVYRKVDSHI